MPDTLKSKTIRGVKWSIIGTYSGVALQIGIVAIMGRLLGPKEYGLFAMANVFTRFTGYFSQMGLGPALIQRENIEQTDVRASFTLAMGLGLGFAFLTFLIAPLARILFQNEAVVPIIRVLAIFFPLTGLSLTPISLLRRELNFKAVALIEILAFALGSGLVAVTCALLGLGVWSLVVGILAQQTIIALTALVSVRHSLMPVFSLEAYRKCLGFGAHYSINTFLDFMYSNVEIFLIGRVFSDKLVGLYNRGYTLASMPVQHFVTSISRVIFPAFSRLQGQKEKLAEAFVTIFVLIGLVCGALSGGMVAAAREIILIVLGEKWSGAAFPLQVLALAVPIQFLISIQGILLDSMGKLNTRTITRSLGLAVKVLVLAVGIQFGFKGLLAAVPVAQACQQMIYVPFITSSIGLGVWKLLLLYSLIVADAGFIGGLIWGVTLVCRTVDLPIVVILVAQLATAGVAFLSVLNVLQRYSLFGIQRDILQSTPLVGRIWRGRSHAY